jgi:heat shock protein HslJ
VRTVFVLWLAAGAIGDDAVAQNSAGLAGTAWQLVRFQGGDDLVRTPDDRSKYTVEFGADGRTAVRFDCNRGAGAWKSGGPAQIEFGPMATTRAACPPGSLHDQLVKHWPSIRSYVIRDGHLFLALMADGGTYEFEPRVDGAGQAVRLQCGNTAITTTSHGEALDLAVDGKTFTLRRTRSASGARYETAGPPPVRFWSRGQAASLTIGSTKYPECKRL